MGWATRHIDRLRAGETVAFRPRGNSMTGIISSGDLCTVAPIGVGESIAVDDVVLCKVRGAQYLHLVKSLRAGQFLIGNNRGGVNGWIARGAIHGRLVSVEK